jgi:hypothetical protein
VASGLRRRERLGFRGLVGWRLRRVTCGRIWLPKIRLRNREMTDLAFVLLTVAIFVLLGLAVKAVERL